MQNLLIPIFYDVDNYYRNYFLADNPDSEFMMIKSKTLSLSEVMTITIYFHLSWV